MPPTCPAWRSQTNKVEIKMMVQSGHVLTKTDIKRTFSLVATKSKDKDRKEMRIEPIAVVIVNACNSSFLLVLK